MVRSFWHGPAVALVAWLALGLPAEAESFDFAWSAEPDVTERAPSKRRRGERRVLHSLCPTDSVMTSALAFTSSHGISNTAVQSVRRATVLIKTLPMETLRGRITKKFGEVRWNSFSAESGSGIEVCSGVLVGPNIVLTAHHCFRSNPDAGVILPEVKTKSGAYRELTDDEWATFLVVEFDYENYGGRTGDVADIARLGARSKRHDYALARIFFTRAKTNKIGLRLDSVRDLVASGGRATPLAMTHHPAGSPRAVSTGYRSRQAESFSYNLKAAAGSSGAPLIDRSGRLVGIHSGSVGCAAPDRAQFGVPARIFRNSLGQELNTTPSVAKRTARPNS